MFEEYPGIPVVMVHNRGKLQLMLDTIIKYGKSSVSYTKIMWENADAQNGMIYVHRYGLVKLVLFLRS